MKDQERQQAILKIIRYVSSDRSVHWSRADAFRKETQKLASAVLSITAELDDDKLRNLVKVSGIAAQESSNLAFLSDAIVEGKEDRMLEMINHHTLFHGGPDFEQTLTLIQIMKENGHDPLVDVVHREAHRMMIREYEGFDLSDKWTYERNTELVALVDRFPEDVEGILRLRTVYGHRDVTDELLAEYRGTHAAVTDGWL